MRVLMLTWEYPPKVVGGLGRHVTALCRALVDRGVGVTVLTACNEGPEEELKDGLEAMRIREHNPPALNFPEGIAQWNTSLLEGALRLVAKGRTYDIVHAHDWLTAYAARALKHSLRIPLITTIHATEFGRHGGLFDDLQRHISDVEWWLTFESWRVICCSRAMKGELGSVFQVPGDKVCVVPNGVTIPSDEEFTSEQRELRSRYVEEHERLLFFVGRLVHEKGVDLLLRAFPQVLASHPQTVLVVAGKGPAEESLAELARRLGLFSRVRFTGYISDEERNTLYRAADAAVFPSRYEPFGIVALEAMAYGAPVVAAGTGGLAEVVDHGRTGLLFRPGDSGSLAESLITVLDSPSLRRSLARRARQIVAAKFDWREIADRTVSIYRDVLNAAPGGAGRPRAASERGAGGNDAELVMSGQSLSSRYR